MNQCGPIDFVMTWVDNTDVNWCKKKAKFTNAEFSEGNEDARYRDWNTLKYWFRGVEKFAPWVRTVYFITDNQKPEWLNFEHPKLKWINHSDFIPKEYLPTFNSNTIEWNLHRIEGLSENFVYFNDDVFLINKTKPKDFFINAVPCDLPNLGVLYPDGLFSHTMFNNMGLLNRHFSFKKAIKQNPSKWIKKQSLGGLLKLILYGRRDAVPYSVSYHIHTKFNKKNFEILWEKEYEIIHETCKNRLRTKDDVTLYCVRDWQLFSNEFTPQKPIGKYFTTESISRNNEAIKCIEKQKAKIICLNDTEDEINFKDHRIKVIKAFEKILPEKSSFEL